MRNIILLVCAVHLAACGDGSGPAQVGRDSSDAAVFARFDGVPWGSDQGPTDTIGVWDPNAYLRLQGVVSSPQRTWLVLDLGFAGAFVGSRQAYPLSTTAYYHITLSSGSGLKSYQSMHGRYTVDSYDPSTQYLVGTFEFYATQTDGPDWTPDSLPVTSGTFRGFIKVP